MQQKSLMRFMLAYSIINLAYAVLQAFSLMSKCITVDSLYCPDLYYSQFSQYYKIIGVEYAASVLKTLSNVCYFCISVNRYILLEKDSRLANFFHDHLIAWSTKKKTFWCLALVILILGLNTHKILIYKVLDHAMVNLLYPDYKDLLFMLPVFLSNSKAYEQYFMYDEAQVTRAKAYVYETFTYLNFLLNDVALFVSFTVVDALLLAALRKATLKKKLLLAETPTSVKLKQQVVDLEKAAKRVLRVIIFNTIILLAVKSFDLAVSVAKFKIWKDDLTSMAYNRRLNSFCHTVSICMVYEDLVKILFIFFCSFSMFTFYSMNKNYSSLLKIMCCSRFNNH